MREHRLDERLFGLAHQVVPLGPLAHDRLPHPEALGELGDREQVVAAPGAVGR